MFGALAVLLVLFLPVSAVGEMTSTSYIIYADSIDAGGLYSDDGVLSLSSEDTVGEAVNGVSNSGTYVIRAGYQYMDRGFLGVSVSNSALSLGTLNKNTISSAETTISVSTDSATGYAIYFGNVSGTSIAPVTDGEVSVGAEEFGVAVAGVNDVVAGDVAVTSNLQLDYQTTPTNLATTTLTFKASISGISSVGYYSQTIPLIVSSNVL